MINNVNISEKKTFELFQGILTNPVGWQGVGWQAVRSDLVRAENVIPTEPRASVFTYNGLLS